ncbi:MAG: TonB-dependent receptor plug domain-containing protein, partial [Candidatus Omnitrophota bacterium]
SQAASNTDECVMLNVMTRSSPSCLRAIPVDGIHNFRPYLRRIAAGAIGLLLCVRTSALAIEDADLFGLSLEDLSKVEIKSDIASIRAKPIREQPGIVTVITATEIRDTGARDLSEILMLVPGFSLDVDVESVVGLTFRGMQGQEGKIDVIRKKEIFNIVFILAFNINGHRLKVLGF